MDIEMEVDFLDGKRDVVLKDGCTVHVVSESAMDFVYRKVCEQIPCGHTVFMNYDPIRGEWRVEIFDKPRDYKNEAIWSGRFVLKE